MIPTNQTIEVKDYPYGYKLRTTLLDSMEFNPKKGYRRVQQTYNPKNGSLNKPKKDTYSHLEFREFDENGHIKSIAFNLFGADDANKVAQYLAANFDSLTKEEIEYAYITLLSFSKADAKATCIYAGANWDDIKEFYAPYVETCVKGVKEGGNLFASLVLDKQAIKAKCPENYNPFKVSYS